MFEIGASEPTPNGITSSFYYLWKEKEKRQILVNEILKVIPENFDLNDLTSDMVDSIDYLTYFVKEALRMDSPASGTFCKSVTEDIHLKDLTIKKGTDLQFLI